MSKSRREFLTHSSLGLLGAAVACKGKSPEPASSPSAATSTPGAPPAFATAPAVGPEVSAETFAQAEKLVEVELNDAERAEAAGSWRQAMAPLYERRVGPRKVALEPTLAPWSRVEAVQPGQHAGPERDRFIRSKNDAGTLPANDEDIAFASVAQLSRWIEQRRLTSERLTGIYLDRLTRFDPKLRCVITLTREHALQQAKVADAEITAGKYRGPLHGIPYGVKDLLDTAGIPTTYGAEPYRNRVPVHDSAVVERLNAAGAVLVAILLSCGVCIGSSFLKGAIRSEVDLVSVLGPKLKILGTVPPIIAKGDEKHTRMLNIQLALFSALACVLLVVFFLKVRPIL